MKRVLTESETKDLLEILRKRFEKNMHRHDGMTWEDVKQRLVEKTEKMWSLGEMERTEGEPDVIGIDSEAIIFCDCSPESPIGRRSLCYDMAAWESRKEHKCFCITTVQSHIM